MSTLTNRALRRLGNCMARVAAPTAESHNWGALLRHGPGRVSGFRRWIVARDPAAGLVLVGGGGPFGVAELWERETPDHKFYEGYGDAAEVVTKRSLDGLNDPLNQLQKENARREAEVYEKYRRAQEGGER